MILVNISTLVLKNVSLCRPSFYNHFFYEFKTVKGFLLDRKKLMFTLQVTVDTANCMFQNNVFKVSESFNITMINNGTGDCISTFLSFYTLDSTKITLTDFWTTSEVTPVRIYEGDNLTKPVYEYTRKENDNLPLILKDRVFKIKLPAGKSLMITCNLRIL